MRTEVIATVSSTLLAGTPTGAVSPAAQYIQQQSQEQLRRLQGLSSFGHSRALAEVEAIVEEHLTAGWDGADAQAVDLGSVEHARSFIDALPIGTPSPSVGIEPDGQVTFEWYTSTRRLLSVSFSRDGELHYAAIFGARRQYGTEPFMGEAPRVVLELIRRVGSG